MTTQLIVCAPSVSDAQHLAQTLRASGFRVLQVVSSAAALSAEALASAQVAVLGQDAPAAVAKALRDCGIEVVSLDAVTGAGLPAHALGRSDTLSRSYVNAALCRAVQGAREPQASQTLRMRWPMPAPAAVRAWSDCAA